MPYLAWLSGRFRTGGGLRSDLRTRRSDQGHGEAAIGRTDGGWESLNQVDALDVDALVGANGLLFDRVANRRAVVGADVHRDTDIAETGEV